METAYVPQDIGVAIGLHRRIDLFADYNLLWSRMGLVRAVGEVLGHHTLGTARMLLVLKTLFTLPLVVSELPQPTAAAVQEVTISRILTPLAGGMMRFSAPVRLNDLTVTVTLSECAMRANGARRKMQCDSGRTFGLVLSKRQGHPRNCTDTADDEAACRDGAPSIVAFEFAWFKVTVSGTRTVSGASFANEGRPLVKSDNPRDNTRAKADRTYSVSHPLQVVSRAAN